MADGFIRVPDIDGNQVCIGRKLPDNDLIEVKSRGKQHKVSLKLLFKEFTKLMNYTK